MKMKDDIKNAREWYYYLHEDGNLISTNPLVLDAEPKYFESIFAKKVWKLNMNDRGSLWSFVLEALANGAKIESVQQLAILWRLTIEDSLEMIRHVEPNKEQTLGLNILIVKIFHMELAEYWDMIAIKAEEM